MATYLSLSKSRRDDVVWHSSFVDLLRFEVPVSLIAVLVEEWGTGGVGGCDTFASHNVACSCAFVEVTVGLFGCQGQP